MNINIDRIVNRLINIDQKPERFKEVLHNNWLKENEIKNEFQLFLKNEDKIYGLVKEMESENKKGGITKDELDKAYKLTKETLKNIDLNNSLSLNEVNTLENLKKSLKEINRNIDLNNYDVKDLKVLVPMNIEYLKSTMDNKTLAQVDFLSQNTDTVKVFAELITENRNAKTREKDKPKELKEVEKLLKDNGVKIDCEENKSITCEIIGKNIFYSNQNGEFEFSSNKNVQFDKLSVDQKEKYSIEAKAVSQIFEKEVNGTISKEEVQGTFKNYYSKYLENYNPKILEKSKGDLGDMTLVYNKFKEQFIDTLNPKDRESLVKYIKENSPLELEKEDKQATSIVR